MSNRRSHADVRYDVCLSFAGENRRVVQNVAKRLTAQGIRVFYDEYEKAELWGKDLYSHLDEVYTGAARYCVLFVSKPYAKKLWANHERKSAQTRAFKQHSEYILPVRLDDTEIPGLRSTLGYIDLRRTTQAELVQLILKKIGKPELSFYLPPKPDRLFKRMGAKTAREKGLVHYQASVIVDTFRRMTKEERLLIAHVFLDGCCAELPENIHISIDLLSRCSGFPEAKIVRLLGNLRSLGFTSKVRPHTNDGFLGNDPAVELSFHVMQMDYEGPNNSTIILNEMMLGGVDGYCSDHAMPLLERADFSQLASVTTKLDEHRGDGKSRRAPGHHVRHSPKTLG